MQDRWEYTIPANTAEADKVKVECKISPGTLKDLDIYFPAGCQDLARCRIFLGEKNIAPRSGGSHISGEDTLIPFHGINERVREDLSVLNWFVWNLDDTFDHTIWLSAVWTEEDEPYDKKSYSALEELNSALRRILRL